MSATPAPGAAWLGAVLRLINMVAASCDRARAAPARASPARAELRKKHLGVQPVGLGTLQPLVRHLRLGP